MKKITLFGLSLAGLALLAFPHSGQAFELKEEWVVKCGVQYQDGKILRFNNAFREQFEEAGFVFSGVSPDNRLVEIVEIPENKFFVACQYHPELSSRPNRPEELYTAFVTAAVENSN